MVARVEEDHIQEPAEGRGRHVSSYEDPYLLLDIFKVRASQVKTDHLDSRQSILSPLLVQSETGPNINGNL